MSRSFRSVALSLVLMLMSAAALAAPQAYGLRVDGIACPFCAYRLEKQLSAIEAVGQIDVDIETGMATVTMAEGAALDEATAKQVVEAAGFRLRGFEKIETTAQSR